MQILIIRPGAIGDTLLTLPVIQALRTKYDQSHITLVGNAAVLPLAHASSIVDDIYDYQEVGWSSLFLTESRGDVRLETMVQHTQLAICWLRDPTGIVARNLKQAGIEKVIVAPGRPDSTTSQAMHITTYLAKTSGIETWQQPLQEITLSLPSIIAQEKGRGTVAIHPGSGAIRKCWPIEYFAEVIYYLWQQDRAVLLLAGPAEQERLALLCSLLQSYPRIGQCEYLIEASLLTVAQRLQQCQCYIGNDTGLTHLAAMLGLPTVALFGPSDPVLWHPPGPRVNLLHERVLEQLRVETVLAKLGPLLT